MEQNRTQMSHSGDLLLCVGVPYRALFLIRRQFTLSSQELSWAILYQRVIETLFPIFHPRRSKRKIAIYYEKTCLSVRSFDNPSTLL